MTKEEAWQKYQQEIMPTKRNYVYPLEGAFYKTWSRARDEAVNAERDKFCAVLRQLHDSYSLASMDAPRNKA